MYTTRSSKQQAIGKPKAPSNEPTKKPKRYIFSGARKRKKTGQRYTNPTYVFLPVTGNDEIEQKGMVPEYSGRLRTRVLIRGTLTSKIRVFSTLHI